MLLAAAFLAATAPAAVEGSPAGNYAIRQMEMAGGLELKPDGHFRYALSSGAVLFRFHCNDLGKVAFQKQPLERNGRDLQLLRYETAIRFIQVRP